MNSFIPKMTPILSRLNRRHLQLFLVVLYLVLFVLGAGAPGAGGGVGI